MTLLVSWVGIDSRSPSSVYIATDSRLTWANSTASYDFAIKTFATKRFPAIFGYCGDSLASLMLISQAVAVIDAIPDYRNFTLEDITNLFVRLVTRNYEFYPVNYSTGDFTVVVCGKSRLISNGDFEAYRIYSDFKSTKKEKLRFPKKSGPLVVAGSGDENFKSQYDQHQKSQNPNRSTSRDVFHAFYRSISKGDNPSVGYIPQITGVHRKQNTGGFHCGLIVNKQRYVAGQLVDSDMLPGDLNWFNDKFEITNPQTKQREIGAQEQPPFQQ